MWPFAYASDMNSHKLKLCGRKQQLVHRRGFWSLITLLVLCSAPAYAEGVAVEQEYLSSRLWMIYIETYSIQREGNMVMVWQLIDFKTMQGGRSPTRFLSTKTQKQIDCAKKRFRFLAFTAFTDGMGTGIPDDGFIDKHV